MLDTSLHAEIIKLAVAYTLLGAFVFTVVITCLSLIGLVKFAEANQQAKFSTLIVEVVVIGVGAFSNFLKFDARTVQKQVQAPALRVAEESKAKAQSINDKYSALLLSDGVRKELIKGLRPEAAKLAQELIDAAQQQGIDLRIVAGFRSVEEQDRLYARGRTQPGDKVTNSKGGCSIHNTGLAFDVGVFQDGNYVDDSPIYSEVGRIGTNLGLVWGGDWLGFQDVPHFQTQDAEEARRLLCSAVQSQEQAH